MKKPNLLIVFVLALSFVFILNGCKVASPAEEAPLTLLTANWEDWVGGQPGVGGRNYVIHLQNQEKASLQLQELTIDNKVFDYEEDTQDGVIVLRAFESFSDLDPDKIENMGEKYVTKPKSGVIHYQLGDRSYRLIIDRFNQYTSKNRL